VKLTWRRATWGRLAGRQRPSQAQLACGAAWGIGFSEGSINTKKIMMPVTRIQTPSLLRGLCPAPFLSTRAILHVDEQGCARGGSRRQWQGRIHCRIAWSSLAT
jgi:hypothetical protein